MTLKLEDLINAYRDGDLVWKSDSEQLTKERNELAAHCESLSEQLISSNYSQALMSHHAV